MHGLQGIGYALSLPTPHYDGIFFDTLGSDNQHKALGASYISCIEPPKPKIKFCF